MIALYFTVVPKSYEMFIEDMRQLEEQYEHEEEEWCAETLNQTINYVSSLSAAEAREKLINILYQQQLDYRYRNDDCY